jgi:pyruvate decarboxylase
MGKTAISEEHEQFCGIYSGTISSPEVKARVEGASLILFIGSLKSDLNTGGFTYKIPTEHTIEVKLGFTC